MTPERLQLIQKRLSRKPEFGVFDHRGKKLHYLKAGQGPNLLLLHGANIGLIMWYPNLEALTEHFTVYALDLPGTGDSDPPEKSNASFSESYISPLAAFVEKHLANDLHAIIGHSFSGWLTVKLAKLFQPKKMILVNPMGFTRRVPFRHLPLTIHPLARLLARTVMKPTEANMEKFTTQVCYNKEVEKDFIKAYCSSLSEEKHPFLFINSLSQAGRIHPELFLGQEDAVATPTMIIHGKKDFLIKENDLKHAYSLLSQPDFRSFHKSGHVPSMEEAEKFNALSKEFLLGPNHS